MARESVLLALLWSACAEPRTTAATALPAANDSASEAPAASPASVDDADPAEHAPSDPAEATTSLGRVRALEVPGFQSALLYTPPGRDLRPLLVAAHGAGGAPDWDCEYWRRLTEGRVFLLCLRGTPLGTYDGYYYRDHHALDHELTAAEQAARAADPRIAPTGGAYAGFSQGSTMGTAMIAPHAAAFPYLILIEGFQLWNIPQARAFAKAGGKRVLIACGSKECAKIGKESAHWLEVAGVESKLEFARGAGHTPGGEVMTRVEAALPWLLGGEALWH